MNKRFSFFIVASVLAMLACSITSIGGGPIRVTKIEDTNDGQCTTADCSLREAIIEANERAGKNTITVPEGTYLMTLGQRLVIQEDVSIEGAGRGVTVIDGQGATSSLGLFNVQGASVQISDLMVKNVDASGAAGGAFYISRDSALSARDVVIQEVSAQTGGAIYSAGDLDFERGHFFMNSAQTGGAIVLASDSQLIMDGSVFTDNHADGNGGALYVSAGADVDLEGAFLSNSSDGQGGAIFNQGIISLNRVRLLENSAQNGGALYNGSGGQVEIVASSLKDNRAVGAGGAIFNSQGAINLIKSSLVGNRASDGAGAWLSLGSFMQITNSTISANRDSNRGAGVMNSGGQLVISFSTIFNNAPHSGLFVLDGDTLVDNSIVAGNQGGNCSGEITSEGHNLKGDDTCGSLAEGDIIESDAGLSGLVPAGSTYHHPLELDSPAIDAGANLNCPDDDQGGHSRPQGEACDIGAIELEDLLAAQLEAPTMPPVQAGESTSVPVTVQASSCTYTALVNLFCRQGPGVVYPQVDSFVPGQSASVNGQSQDGNYYYVVGPNSGQTCAVPSGDEFGEVSGACQGLPQFTPQPVPPTATNSPVPPTETAEANSTISGTVWEDVDGGQDIDGGEPRLGSVTVELRAGGCGGGVSQTTTTNGNGGYGFGGLSAGSYCVRVELPPGNWAATTPDFPANQAPTREVAVGASELLVGVNFGLQQVVQ